MIALVYGMDSSVQEHIQNGLIRKIVKEVNNFSRIGKIVLFTHDVKNYSVLFKDVVHIPCGLVSTLFLRKILYPFSGLFYLLKYSHYFKVIRVIGVACPQAVLVSKLTKKPLIVSYHYEWAKEVKITLAKQNLIFRILFLSDFLYFIAQAIEHFIIKNADIVIALMPYLGSVAKRKGAKKVIIIPNGVDFKLIKKYSIY